MIRHGFFSQTLSQNPTSALNRSPYTWWNRVLSANAEATAVGLTQLRMGCRWQKHPMTEWTLLHHVYNPGYFTQEILRTCNPKSKDVVWLGVFIVFIQNTCNIFRMSDGVWWSNRNGGKHVGSEGDTNQSWVLRLGRYHQEKSSFLLKIRRWLHQHSPTGDEPMTSTWKH